MTMVAQAIDVVLFASDALDSTEELTLGMREIRKRLPQVRRWYAMHANTIPAADFPAWSDAPWVLVILDPALLVSDNLLDELLALTNDGALCALPADPRGFAPGMHLDYASRPGFDRFVARLVHGPRRADHDNREPWVYLVARDALLELGARHSGLSWSAVPALLGARTALAYHAFVHSFAHYHSSTRSEMLRLLPPDTHHLLDVGGGYGNFARVFMAERGGQATLLESNPHAAAVARDQGVDVLVGDFLSMAVTARFDAVALLDVLEHLAEPLAALVKARQVLRPGGVLLLSVPNMGHWSVVWDLLEGKFDYQPVGILCNTHLRFFTRHGLESLIADAGFRVERWDDVSSPPPQTFADFLDTRSTPGVVPDLVSLRTESFHVLARRD
jgi:SAM-dependent methyltransferase